MISGLRKDAVGPGRGGGLGRPDFRRVLVFICRIDKGNASPPRKGHFQNQY